MMQLKTILVDDEILNLKNLEILLNENFKEIEIIGLFQNVEDARHFIENNTIDLVFLYIAMPLSDGFDLLNFFPKRIFQTIFVTAYEEFAIKAIRAGAIDYILKPFILEELKIAVKKAIELNLLQKDISSKQTITITYEGGKSILAFDEIINLKGLDNLSVFYLTGNRTIVVSKTLKYYENLLGNRFVRIHKSYIVNLDFVGKIVANKPHFIELKNGKELPVSRRNFKYLNELVKKSL
jgi:two-component system LytT family response regulator